MEGVTASVTPTTKISAADTMMIRSGIRFMLVPLLVCRLLQAIV